MRLAPVTAGLLLVVLAGCGGGSGQVAVEAPSPTAIAAVDTDTDTATDADGGGAAAEGDGDAEARDDAGTDDPKPDPRGELTVGDDKQEAALQVGGSGGDGVLAGGDGRLCALLPTDQIRTVLGGEAEVQDITPDTCTYTYVDGQDVTIASVTRVQIQDGFPFEDAVQTQAESLDADMVAEPMSGLGDRALVIDGNLGVYLHVIAGEWYLVTYVSGPINRAAAAESLTRLALGTYG